MNTIKYISFLGPLTASMIAAARCLSHPSFKIQALLRAVLRDEMIAWNKKNVEPTSSITVDANGQQQVDTKDGEVIIERVGKAVTAITARLTSLSQFDGTESKVNKQDALPPPLNNIISKVGQLVAAACSPDNLCRMDPAWHPWL